MQLMTLLHNMFKKKLDFVHKVRLENLMAASTVAVRTHKLYLTGLGRELFNKNKTCSNIQKIDRLLGNKNLHQEQGAFYQHMSSYIIKEQSAPWLHIDWSCINAKTKLYVLRASLSMSGRAIVIYEECHGKKEENNHAAHKVFLNNLKASLPASVKPIIVTDGGFRAPWFCYVRSLGWDFVGRLRNKNLVLMDNTQQWRLSKNFFPAASSKPSYIGHGLLTKDGKVAANLVLYKGVDKSRHKININKKISQSGKSKKFSKASKEPWLLVTSLASSEEIAKQTVNIYRQRMRIEENIRDTKDNYYGLGLKKSLSRSTARVGILLLIAAIATFAAWLAGIFTTFRGRASDFQAHSAKFTSVLSKVFLGREALRRQMKITKRQINDTLERLYQIAVNTRLESHFYE